MGRTQGVLGVKECLRSVSGRYGDFGHVEREAVK
jgi:hypothetical protein